jgi:folylpolyglutamate synthase/dihydropteroate synthase
MADKDIGGILKPLLPLASEIIFTAPNYGRAAAPQHLADYAASMGFSNVHLTTTVREAVEKAIKCSNELSVTRDQLKDSDITSFDAEPNTSRVARHASLILITGSFYTLGEAKEALGEEAVLSTLRDTL